jgi:hydrogenase maturation protease
MGKYEGVFPDFCMYKEEMNTLILGIGNRILSDDGVGPRLIEELRTIFEDPCVTLQDTCLSGMNLLDLLAGYDRAIVIDAIQSGGKPGDVYRFTEDDFRANGEKKCHHSMNLFEALELGRELNQHIPSEVIIIAIEARDVSNFGECLTEEVEQAIPVALEKIMAEVREEGERISKV